MNSLRWSTFSSDSKPIQNNNSGGTRKGASSSYPDSEWNLATELLYTEDLFSAPESISLEIEIQSTEPYPLDTSFVKVDCQFDLKVYIDEMSGYRASGEAIFITEETSDGVWSISRWQDFSEVKERCTWSMIKYIFYEGLL